MRLLNNDQRKSIVEGKKNALGLMKYGEWIAAKSGLSIDELIRQGAKDRLKLAKSFLTQTSRLLKISPRPSRIIIGRAYYSMYHAARATVFAHYRGDDNEKHADLPDALPGDFPDRIDWVNNLKLARLERNLVDYFPYPFTEKGLAKKAVAAINQAKVFLPLSEVYLTSKGML